MLGSECEADPFILQGKYTSWHSLSSTSQDPSVMRKEGLKIKQNKVKMLKDKENRVEDNSKQQLYASRNWRTRGGAISHLGDWELIWRKILARMEPSLPNAPCNPKRLRAGRDQAQGGAG